MCKIARISSAPTGKHILKSTQALIRHRAYIGHVINGGNDRQCLKAKSLRNYLLQSFSCLPLIYLGLVTVTDRILGLR